MTDGSVALGLTGGGTAGHVLPHFAIVSNNDSPLMPLVSSGQVKVYYFGSKLGLERDLVCKSKPDWTYVSIRTGKLRRYFSVQNFLDPFNIVLGFLTAVFWIRKYKIRCVFSKGGFVSAPVVWAAWLNRVPVVIHESDATPALATKLTLPFAHRALVSFAETLRWIPERYKEKVRISGIPLRSDLFARNKNEARRFFGFENNLPTLLVFGGSLGAEALNKKFSNAVADLDSSWNVIHIVGKGKGFELPNLANYRQYEFLSGEMSLAYAVADVAICRAGASSIFELAAARVPMILVPLGLHQSRGDQIINARIFADKGWAVWCNEDDLTKEKIISLVGQLHEGNKDFKEKLENAPGAETAARVAALLSSILKQEKVAEPF